MTQHTEKRIAYYCMSCPEVFYDAKTSNAHHDKTGHHQHWEHNRSYAARQAWLNAEAYREDMARQAGER